MMRNSRTSSLNRRPARRARPRRGPQPSRPKVERLESRALLATASVPPFWVGPVVAPPAPLPAGLTVQGTASNQAAVAGIGEAYWDLAQFTIPGELLVGHTFEATIDWGDGSAATPGVFGGNGSTLSFSGEHTYARAGTYGFTVIDFIDGSLVATATGTITVAPFTSVGDGVTGTGVAVSAQTGTAASNIPVASFSGPGTTLEVGAPTATIDWGDGTTSAGVVPAQDGDYWMATTIPVFGSHTYAAPGQYPITVTLSIGGNAVGSATDTATVAAGAAENPLVATAPDHAAIAGAPNAFAPLATLTAPAGVLDTDSGLSAVVDWGDGTPAESEFAFAGWNNGQTVAMASGRHDYATPGTYTYTITFTLDGIATATASGSMTVSAPSGPIAQGTATDQSTAAGLPSFFGSLATFTIPEAIFDGSGGFTTSIAWGDGSAPSTGIPDLGGATERIAGEHTYTQPGSYTFTVTYISDGQALGSASGTVTVAASSGPILQGQGTDQTATAGVPTLFQPLATFSAPSAAMTDFTARSTVEWGDGTTTSAIETMDLTTQGGRTSDAVAGRHVYAQPGTYTYTVTYTLDDSITATATGTITVAAGTGPVAVGQGTNTTATAGVPDAFYPLASFTMPKSVFMGGATNASFDWGDGSSPSTGLSGFTWQFAGDQVVVSVGSGHTYAEPGTYTYVVSYIEDGATLATATGQITVSAADPANPVVTGSAPDVTATAGVPVDLTGSFTGPTSVIGAGTYGNTESFGDGSTVGTFSGFTWEYRGQQVTYHESLLHTYDAPGTYTYQITFLFDGVAVATATGTVTVVAAGDGGGQAQPIFITLPIGVGPQPFDGPTSPAPTSTPTAASSPTSTPAAAPVSLPVRTAVASVTTPAASPFAIPEGFDIDITLEGLWAGLFTAPNSSPTPMASTLPQSSGTISPTDPLFYWDKGLDSFWDAGLQLLAT